MVRALEIRARAEKHNQARRERRKARADAHPGSFIIKQQKCIAPDCERLFRPLRDVMVIQGINRERIRDRYCSQTCFERHGK